MRHANLTVCIAGTRATLEGKFPAKAVRDATSYVVKGFQFQPRFKHGRWDGRHHFLTRPGNSCPAGLVPTILRALDAWSSEDDRRTLTVKVVDKRVRPEPRGKTFDVVGLVLRDYQRAAAQAAVEAGQGVLKMATNAGKTATFAAMLRYLDLPALLVVPGLDLLYQIQTELGKLLSTNVGVIGDGQWQVEHVTVSTPQSLAKLDTNIRNYLKTLDIIGVDECHQAAAQTIYSVLRACPAYYRFGMSGTPLSRTDGADMRLIAQTGEVVYEVTNKQLVEYGLSIPAEIEFLVVDKPVLPDKMQYPEVYRQGIVQNEQRNVALVQRVMQYVSQGLQAVVLVRELVHGELLFDLFSQHRSNPSCAWINGSEAVDRRKAVIEEFKSGKVRIIIATNIMNQGISINNIDVLVNAAGGKSRINTLQRLGRGLRVGGNSAVLHMIEFGDMGHRYLARHSLQRLRDYRDEDCFKIIKVPC